MSADTGPDQTSVSSLKQELKAWEKLFASQNGGRKPGREDIKNDATIAIKYKEYDVLRRKPTNTHVTPRKDKRNHERGVEPGVLRERPANATAATPRRGLKGKNDVHLIHAPTLFEEEPTPACVRFALGPTPQKDGAVLGIFDTLPVGTPSKGANVSVDIPELAVSATPSKHVQSSFEAVLSRTPQSSGKRFFLGAFAGTPLKRKRQDDERTPSTAKRQFATPLFLRRSIPLARVDEETDDGVVSAPPFKRRGLVRSLSTIIQGLRKQEEERMDDEWEIMRELEEEETGIAAKKSIPKVLVEDSQVPEMPLGPNRGVEPSDEEVDVDPGSLDRDGNPRKVWKKKGQKRTTKRVKMRPVMHKAKKAAVDEDLTAVTGDIEIVEETQNLAKPAASQPLNSDDEFGGVEKTAEGSDYDDGNAHLDHKQKSKKAKRKTVELSIQEENDKKAPKAKKVNAQAHANFRKLKIKNKNSKANGGGRKFGRR